MVRKASEGFRELLERTGGADVQSTVLVDQPYAQDQHENLTYRHVHGGQAKYLEEPMVQNAPRMAQGFADLLLDAPDAALLWHHKLGLETGQLVKKHAPREFNDLRESAAITTKSGGSIVAHRPANQHRLTEAELDAKTELRGEHGWRMDFE